MDKEYNLIGLIRILLRWKKQIFYITLASGILTAAFTLLFMDDYYKSLTTFFPINMAFNDRAAIYNNEHVDYYGGKDDLNRVLTVAQSMPLEDYLIAKYNLADHYKINKNRKYWATKVRKEFEENYKAIKTEQNAVEITLLDIDPKQCAIMLSDAINYIDSTYRNIEMGSKNQQLATFRDQIVLQQTRVTQYQDTLAALERKYHIKIKSATDHTDIVDGDDNNAVQLYKTFTTLQKNSVNELNFRINIKEQIENSLENSQKCLAVINSPIVADRKEKPVRSLLIVTAMLLTFVVSVFGVLIFDQIEDIRKKL